MQTQPPANSRSSVARYRVSGGRRRNHCAGGDQPRVHQQTQSQCACHPSCLAVVWMFIRITRDRLLFISQAGPRAPQSSCETRRRLPACRYRQRQQSRICRGASDVAAGACVKVELTHHRLRRFIRAGCFLSTVAYGVLQGMCALLKPAMVLMGIGSNRCATAARARSTQPYTDQHAIHTVRTHPQRSGRCA